MNDAEDRGVEADARASVSNAIAARTGVRRQLRKVFLMVCVSIEDPPAPSRRE